MNASRRLPVHRRRVAEWVDRLRGRGPQTDGVVRDDDGRCFQVHVALPGFQAREIEVVIAPDHVVIDASASREGQDGWEVAARSDLHLVLPFPETVDCENATAQLRGGVLSIRAPRQVQGSRARSIPIRS